MFGKKSFIACVLSFLLLGGLLSLTVPFASADVDRGYTEYNTELWVSAILPRDADPKTATVKADLQKGDFFNSLTPTSVEAIAYDIYSAGTQGFKIPVIFSKFNTVSTPGTIVTKLTYKEQSDEKDLTFSDVKDYEKSINYFYKTFDLRYSAEKVYKDALENIPTELNTKEDKTKAWKALYYPYGETKGTWLEYVRGADNPRYFNMLNAINSYAKYSPETKITSDQLPKLVPLEKKGNFLSDIILDTLGIVAGIVAVLINLELKVVVMLFQQVDAGYQNPELIAIWKSVRDLLNIVFIVALFTMALSNILGFQKDNYGIKKNLPKLIIMVIAINFSRLFVGLVLDAANVIEAAVYNFAGMGPHGTGLVNIECTVNGLTSMAGIEEGSLPCELMRIFRVGDVNTVEADALSGVGTLDVLLAAAVMVIMMIGIAIAFLGILLIFLVRTIALWFLTITSPIFFIGQAFEPLKKFADQWKEKLVKYAFMHVKMAFFLSIGIRVIQGFTNSYNTSSSAYQTVSIQDPLLDQGVVRIGTGAPLNLEAFLMMLLMFACIWMGVFSSMKSDIAAVDGIADKFKGAGKKAMKIAGYVPTFGYGKNIGYKPGRTIGTGVMAAKKIWAERKSTIARGDNVASNEIALGVTKAANKLVNTSGLTNNSLVRNSVLGLKNTTAMTMEDRYMREAIENIKKETPKMDHSNAKIFGMDSLKSNDTAGTLYAAEQMIEIQNGSDDSFGLIGTLLLKNKISKYQAAQEAEKGKNFNPAFLALNYLSEQLEKDRAGFMKRNDLQGASDEKIQKFFAGLLNGGDFINNANERMGVGDINAVAFEWKKGNAATKDQEAIRSLGRWMTDAQIEQLTSANTNGEFRYDGQEERIQRNLLSQAGILQLEFGSEDAKKLGLTDQGRFDKVQAQARESVRKTLERLHRRHFESFAKQVETESDAVRDTLSYFLPESKHGKTKAVVETVAFLREKFGPSIGRKPSGSKAARNEAFGTGGPTPPIPPGGQPGGGHD